MLRTLAEMGLVGLEESFSHDEETQHHKIQKTRDLVGIWTLQLTLRQNSDQEPDGQHISKCIQDRQYNGATLPLLDISM
jgi:hypothetical protein